MKSTLHVFKVGGHIIDDPQALQAFLNDFTATEGAKLLIHGGGKIASELGIKLNIPPTLIEGRRITDEATLDVVVMVYAGLINKKIVAKLQALGHNALGLSGADGNAVLAHKRQHPSIDYGFVGDVDKVNAPFFLQLLQEEYVPICCAISHDGEGTLFNTNADTMAKEIASSLTSHFEVSLVYTFEKAGVLTNPADDSSWIPKITPTEYASYKASGVISGGMIPKLDNAFEAIEEGIDRVLIGKTVVTR